MPPPIYCCFKCLLVYQVFLGIYFSIVPFDIKHFPRLWIFMTHSLVIARFCWQSWCGQDFRLILQYSSPSQLFFCIIIHNCLSFRPSYWVIDHLYYFVIYQECWLTSWHKYDREWSWIDSVKLGTLNGTNNLMRRKFITVLAI